MPNNNYTWRFAYRTACKKVQFARLTGRLYIQVIPHDSGLVQLFARRNSAAANCVPDDYINIADWASKVADKVHELGYCEAPEDTDAIDRKEA